MKENMIKKILIFTLCILLPNLIRSEVINSEVLKFIDGTPLVKIPQLVHFAVQINVFQSGPKSPAQKTMGIKKIMHHGKEYTLEELLALEEQYPDDDYSEALSNAIIIFEAIAMPYLENARGSEEYMVKLILAWSKQRNKPSTYLLVWSQVTKNEHEIFVKNMTSLTKLNEFCNDLKLFLTDFMNTCKKSWKQYKQQREEQQKKK